jgi:hypothetical protein
MQTVGRYLFVAAEKPIGRTDPGRIYYYDLSHPFAVKEIGYFPIGEQPAAVGVAKLTDGRYLMAIALVDTKTIDFYRSTGTQIGQLPHPGWRHLGRWYSRTINGWLRYQAINLLADEHGALFLIGSTKTGSYSWSSGKDRVDAYRLLVFDDTREIILRRVASRTVFCSAPERQYGGLQCNLKAAGGSYVDQNHQLLYYGTEHGHNGKGHSIRMKEFRAVPALGKRECPRMEDSWIEFYEHTDYGGRSIILDYVDRNRRNLTSFSTIDEFNDRASSVKWCISPGHKFEVFEHDNFRGGRLSFTGNGKVRGKARLPDHVLSNGKNAHDQISSGKWR